MITIRDEFLSEEDLDLRNLTFEELIAYWNLWLAQPSHFEEYLRDESALALAPGPIWGSKPL